MARPTYAQAQRVEAVSGAPFGVGRVILDIDQAIDAERLQAHLMSVTERDGRVVYPAVRYTKPLGLVMEVLGITSPTDAPNQLHVHFLFQGDSPFDLELSLPEPQTIRVVPTNRRLAYQRLLRAWWVRYKATTRQKWQDADYSPVIETYLRGMLASQMRLVPPPHSGLQNDGRSFSLLLGTEPLRLAMLSEALAGRVDRQAARSIPLPDPIAWPSDEIPELDEATPIEPIAQYVPEECFYVRFARFENYTWLRKLLEEYGGDLSRMVMLRGTDSQLNTRVEDQLGLRESALSRILGPQVISDVAMLGRDTYLREGAAIGILFEARGEVLAQELMQQRRRRLQELKSSGAEETTIDIDGHSVSCMKTPDSRMRSFYVASGKYHLVTNCYEIARRFLECADGKRTLGNAPEFKHARSLSPLGEDNTLFVYLSRRFFEGLLSPQYQVELRRRLHAVTDLQAWELAQVAAKAQGVGAELPTSDLIAHGFLPQNGDVRADGSRTVVIDGRAHDSVRGAQGTFLPIPDVPLEEITAEESLNFEKTAWYHRTLWKQMDPVLIGLRRTTLDDRTERVAIQARMLPLNKDKYGVFTDVFGPPTTQRIRPLDDDIVSVQAYVDGGSWAFSPHHFYFGLRDQAPNHEYSQRKFLKSMQVMRTAPAYVAAWPRPGVLDSLGLHGVDNGDGFRSMMLGLIRYDAPNEFTLLSFNKDILRDVTPQLGTETTETPAQLFVRVGDIKNSKFGKWADDLDFQRAWETSLGNVELLHLLVQQFHVPIDEAEALAERLLNVKLVCPLGGDYKTMQNSDGTQRWVSSAWAEGQEAARANYVSPLMTWLRGLELQVTIDDDRIMANGHLDIEREKEPGGFLPKFNFFGSGKP